MNILENKLPIVVDTFNMDTNAQNNAQNNEHDNEQDNEQDNEHDNEHEDDLFGESPYVVEGGDISFKGTNFLLYFIIAVIIIAIIMLIIAIVKKVPIKGENYHQRNLHTHFNNIHGEEYDAEAKQAVAAGENIPNPRAIDHFRMGTVYLINGRNFGQARRHFTDALNMLIVNPIGRDANFIIDRIADMQDLLIDDPDGADLPLQEAILRAMQGTKQRVNKIKQEIPEDDPQYVQKVLINQQSWQSDSQNVHDTAIYTELMEQLTQVMEENKKIENIQTKDYQDVVTWLKVRYSNDPVKLDKVQKVISFLNHNYPIGSMPGFHEQDIIVAVWQRSFDPENKAKQADIREALGDSILDCYEGSNVVCMTGRISKIWQALATQDKNPEIGVMRTKQTIRNEIFERSAKIVNDLIGENGTASDMLKSAYLNNESTEQVNELIECMKQQIEQLREDYKDLLPADQLDQIIAQCKETVSN